MKERDKKERIDIRKRKRRFLAFFVALLIGCLPTATAFAESLDIHSGDNYGVYSGRKITDGIDSVTWTTTPPQQSGGQLVDVGELRLVYHTGNEPVDSQLVGSDGSATINVNKKADTGVSVWTVAEVRSGERQIDLIVDLNEAENVYAVTFNPNGGSVNPKSAYTDDGGHLGSLPTPSRSGYDFEGWYTSASGGNQVTTSTTFHENTTIYAHWKEKVPETCTVTFDANGHGTAPDPKVVNKGAKVDEPAEPTAEGWNFSGWFLDDEGKNKYNFSNPVTEDITLYAYWTEEKPGPGPEPTPEDEYNISYKFYDGDSKKEISGVNNDDNPRTYKKNESVSLKDPSKSGYKFDAWYTDNKFTTKTDGIKAGETGDKMFYAKFIKDNSGGRDEDDDDDDDDDDKPFNPNPNALTAFYYLKNGMLDPSAKLGREAQGAVASNLFKSNLPAGWKEAFTFSLSINDKHTYTLKDGTIKLLVPEAFQKAGRKYAILAMGPNGVKFLSDTDTLPEWITVNPNVEGFAFELIYLD